MGMVNKNKKKILVQEPDLIRDGYINASLVSILQGCPNRRPMVPDGAGTPHKLPKAACSYVCSEGICQQPGEYTHPSTYGQHDSCLLCELHGRHLISHNEQTSNPVLEMVFEEEPIPVSRVSTRARQLHSGQGIWENPVIRRVKTEKGSALADNDSMGRILHRSVCLSDQCLVETIHKLEAHPQCNGNRCSSTSMEQVGRICLPTI